MSHGIPHFAVPFRVTRRGYAATVDQDSVDEIVQSVAVILSTRPGERSMAPTFGLADLAFSSEPVPVDEVVEAVQQWEPRATVEDVESAIERIGRTDVTVGLEIG